MTRAVSLVCWYWTHPKGRPLRVCCLPRLPAWRRSGLTRDATGPRVDQTGSLWLKVLVPRLQRFGLLSTLVPGCRARIDPGQAIPFAEKGCAGTRLRDQQDQPAPSLLWATAEAVTAVILC